MLKAEGKQLEPGCKSFEHSRTGPNRRERNQTMRQGGDKGSTEHRCEAPYECSHVKRCNSNAMLNAVMEAMTHTAVSNVKVIYIGSSQQVKFSWTLAPASVAHLDCAGAGPEQHGICIELPMVTSSGWQHLHLISIGQPMLIAVTVASAACCTSWSSFLSEAEVS